MNALFVHNAKDKPALAELAASFIAQAAASAIEDRGRFSIALAGGSTPRDAYARLAQKTGVAWDRWHVFFGDERCVAEDHPESNYRMARETLLSRVAIPEANVHRLEGERADRNAAARDYELCLRGVLGNSNVPQLDLVLLGIGDDGHTASIFPDSVAQADGPDLIVPMLKRSTDQWRLTATYPLLNAARCVAFLAAGGAKAEIVRRVFAVHEDVPLPAARVKPMRGELVLLADHAAAAKLLPE